MESRLSLALTVAFLCLLVACMVAGGDAKLSLLGRVALEPAVGSQSLRTPPAGWVSVSHQQPSRAAVVPLTFALTRRDSGLIQAKLQEVSTPSSPHYGRYLSASELADLVAPPAEWVAAVVDWLASHGVRSYELSRNRDYITAHVDADQAEALLACSFGRFRHTETGQEVMRCLAEYSVPAHVAPFLDLVAGVIRFPNYGKGQLKASVDAFGADAPSKVPITPDMIRKLYSITNVPKVANNLQAVVSFLGQYYSAQDLQQFQKLYGTPVLPIEHTFGPNDPTAPGVEASLDVQYLTGVTGAGRGSFGENIPTWVYSTPGSRPGGNEPFLDWLLFLHNQTTLPHVFSISYQDLEYTVSESYMRRIDEEFAMFGLRGRTFVTGSGDWGVGCKPDFHKCTVFVADFPSSSPHIVSTGATFYNDSTGRENGIAFSSGGFSWSFERPSYQNAAVEAFLQRTRTPDVLFNRRGRAFPDISAIGSNFQVVYNGTVIPVAGTSASTPTFAAVLSLINSLRLAAGRPTLGFVNPFLYQAASAFTDIEECQKQDPGCCSTSFACEKGWDPYTGLGTPNFEKLAALAMDASLFNFPPAGLPLHA